MSTTPRPRVTASSEVEEFTEKRLCDRYEYTSPGVRVVVTFDLHDHAAALDALDRVVCDVRAQIEETKGARKTPKSSTGADLTASEAESVSAGADAPGGAERRTGPFPAGTTAIADVDTRAGVLRDEPIAWLPHEACPNPGWVFQSDHESCIASHDVANLRLDEEADR